MSKEYIEKEAAIRNVCKGCGLFDTDNCICTGTVRCDEYDAILDTSPADVEPVVRCKDCKYYEEHHYEREGEPPYIKGKCGNKFGLNRQYMVHPEEFCSRGERRE